MDACGKLDKWSEITMDIMSNLFEFYVQCSISEKQLAIADEMEMLEDRYSKASEVAMRYLDSLRSRKSPDHSMVTKTKAIDEEVRGQIFSFMEGNRRVPTEMSKAMIICMNENARTEGNISPSKKRS